jgi:hypothetical protein
MSARCPSSGKRSTGSFPDPRRSLTTICGGPRCRMMVSSSRTTRWLDSDESARSARHSRVKSSTITSTRKRRPSTVGQRRSRRSSAGSAPVARPSAPASRARACACHAGAPLLAIEPEQLLMIQRDAVPPQQDVQPPRAEPPPLTRQGLQPLPDLSILKEHQAGSRWRISAGSTAMICSSLNRLFFISVSFRRSPIQTEGASGGTSGETSMTVEWCVRSSSVEVRSELSPTSGAQAHWKRSRAVVRRNTSPPRWPTHSQPRMRSIRRTLRWSYRQCGQRMQHG